MTILIINKLLPACHVLNSVLFLLDSAGQQQIIKILPNSSGQQLKAISKHATKVVAQVGLNHKKPISPSVFQRFFIVYIRKEQRDGIILSLGVRGFFTDMFVEILSLQRSTGMSSTSTQSSSTPTRTGIKVSSQQMVKREETHCLATNVKLFCILHVSILFLILFCRRH